MSQQRERSRRSADQSTSAQRVPLERNSVSSRSSNNRRVERGLKEDFKMMTEIYLKIMQDESESSMMQLFQNHLSRVLDLFKEFEENYVKEYNATLNSGSNASPDGGKENQDECQVQELSTTQSSTEIDLTKLYKKVKDDHLPIKDLLSVWTDRGRTMQDRPYQFRNLTNGSKFEAWIMSPKSKGLLSIDWFESRYSRRITSTLCWLIYQSAIQTSPKRLKLEAFDHLPFLVLPLIYFCSKPSLKNKPEQGAISMYRSLIAQLLGTRFEFNTKKINQNAFKLAYKDNVHGLGSLFSSLMTQLPEGVLVLCMIDGIDYYERKNGGAAFFDYAFHVTNLLHNTESLKRMKATVKLLVTSNAGTTTVKQLTRRDGPFETDQAPLSNRGWHSSEVSK